MTDMQMATGCDCPLWPAEVERDCCCVGGTACMESEAPPPSVARVAPSAQSPTIGPAGGDAPPSGESEPRDTPQGPPGEAGGAVQGYYRAERLAVIRLAEVWHGIGTGKYPTPGPLDDAIRAAVALGPVATCRGCGIEYVKSDGRRRFDCSVRCQQRVAKRMQRARMA